jgi:co-chaperonin GroES (HSP10)
MAKTNFKVLDGGNPSGITPTEYKCLILPSEVSDKIGNVHIPQEYQAREQFACQEGVLIAVAPLAFTYASKDEWERVEGRPPRIGDKVLFAKFAGFEHKGKDGKKYRVVNDKDVSAVLA